MAAVAAAALVAWVGWDLSLSLATISFVYLAIVAVTALLSELVLSLVVALLASLSLNYFFVEPRLQFGVKSGLDVLTLVTFVAAAMLIATLVRRTRALAESGEEKAALLEAAQQGQAAYLDEAQRLSKTGSVAWNVSTGEIRWSEETFRVCEIEPDASEQMARILERVHPDDQRGYRAALRAAVETQGRLDREFRLVVPSGVKILHMVGHFLPERPEQFVGALTDVTDRRRDEAALRESELRYRNIFQAMAVAFWELEFSGVADILRRLRDAGVTDYSRHLADHPEVVREMMRAMRVMDVNDQTVRLYGLGDRAKLLTDVEPFWPEAANGVFVDCVMSTISGANGFSAETRLRRLDGSEFDALFTASFSKESLANRKLVVGIIDISARISAQAALQDLQANFAHASRLSTLGELAASIAHEVNQPLAAMAANADAGLRWLNRPQPDVDEVRALLGHVSADARRASGIIARVRAMAARRPTEKVELDINTIIREAAAFVRHELQNQRVILTLALGSPLPSVLGDRTQLQQVVVNLAINAAQALGASGGAQRRISISTGRDGEDVAVAVDDNGPGVDPAHLDQLFESFFSTKEDGMGIGLSICRSIVEAHGGWIRGENRAEGGARFCFSLPAALPAASRRR